MRALVVEDNFVNRKYLLKIIEPYFECDVVVNGLEAIEAYHSANSEDSPYDLICLDIMIPEMDGQEVLRAIRDDEASKGLALLLGVKIIMISALDDAKNILSSFREGCESYITKPFKPEDLLAELRKMDLIS
jgi:two-component system chemotaxis response regulator CheY